MKKISVLFAVFITFSAYADMQEAKELHDESCLNCHIFLHDASFYNREDRKINNNFKLRAQVSFCVNNLNVEWFPDEQMSVVEYLNKTYYHYNLVKTKP